MATPLECNIFYTFAKYITPEVGRNSRNKMLDNFKCGDYVFDANFDSGNLHSVQLVRLYEGELNI